MVQIMTSSLRHLVILGIWPADDTKFSYKHYLCKYIIILIFSSFLLWGGILHSAIQNSNEADNDLLEDMVTIVGQSCVIYFNSVFAIFYKKIAEIIRKLRDISTFGKPKHFERRNRQISIISRRFRGMIVAATTCIVLYPVLSTKKCKEPSRDSCGMVAPIWLPFVFEKFPIKQILIAWQAWCALLNFVTASAVTSIILETIENLIIRIQHLKQLAPIIIKIPESQLRSQLFSKWIQYHVFISNLGKSIDSTFRHGLMSHASGTAVVLGLAGYSVITNKSTFSVLSLFCGWFLALLLVCISGQRLKDEAASVGGSIYDSSWYSTPPSFQKKLLLALFQSQKPIEIHAGPFTHLSHDLIVTVLKAAFSYINLLQARS